METFSALLAICAGNSPVPGEFPTQRPVTRSFDVYFDLRSDKRLSKQSWGWGDLRRYRTHYDVIVMNSLKPNDKYMRQQARSSLAPIMAYRQIGTKLLSEPMAK